MALNKAFFTTLIILSISACSDHSECFIADSIEEIEIMELNKNNYFLYLITSGFGDKQRFYKLFEGRPQFDHCGLATLQPIVEIHIENQ